ncbi:hypothetical protein [Holospora obtusa]|uniref:hypothetical protein n=1 Tax=Holospora obtusa TaxID=49893 RepID=UPI0003AED042|nr:hypothetical protein [Holospora obtusa]
MFVETVLYRSVREFLGVVFSEKFGDLKPSTPALPVEAKERIKKVFEISSQDDDHGCAMIDTTIVRAHQHSTGSKKKSIIKLLDALFSRHLIKNFFVKLKAVPSHCHKL